MCTAILGPLNRLIQYRYPSNHVYRYSRATESADSDNTGILQYFQFNQIENAQSNRIESRRGSRPVLLSLELLPTTARIRIACVPKIHKWRDRDHSMVASIKPFRQAPDLISLLEDGGEQQVGGIVDLGLVLFEVPPLERVVHKVCGPSIPVTLRA